MSDDTLNKLVSSLLEERNSDRKMRIVYRVLFAIFLFLIIYFSLSSPINNDIYRSEHTAVIKVDGVIATNGGVNTENLLKLVRKAFDNELCKNIILKINSPGGSATQSKIIYDEILRLKKSNTKKVFSVIEDVGASGGYYIAASADKIFASSSSIVGSIGVRIDSFNFKRLINKLGIESQTISSGNDKLILDPFNDLTEDHKIHLTQLAEDIHNEFINDIMISRGKLLKDKEDAIFTGLFWTGNVAKDIGLIDNVASIYEVNREYFNNHDLIIYNQKPSILESLLNAFMKTNYSHSMGFIYR